MSGTTKDREILLKAFDTARAWSSLIVTLSTGGIVFTAVFKKEFLSSGTALVTPWLLWGTWILLGASAVAGVFYLSAITALLNKGEVWKLDVYDPPLRLIGIVQITMFMAGLILFLLFIIINQ